MELTEQDKKYMRTVDSNVPKGYEVLSPGWPDEEHGITWDNYADYCIELVVEAVRGTEEGDDIPNGPSPTFQEWKEMERETNEDRDDLGFVNEECHLCGALPGERYAVTAMKLSEPGEYVPLSVCCHCIAYVANGDLPDEGEWE
jgi:hypothetical protein